MKIYNVYAGEMYDLEVVETKKMYVAEKRIAAFYHKERFSKQECFLTKEDAVADFIKKGKGEIELLEGAIANIKGTIEKLRAENYTNAG